MANNTTKKAGSNKSFIDRMGGQKFIRPARCYCTVYLLLCHDPNFKKIYNIY